MRQRIIVALVLGLAPSMAEAQTPRPSQPRLPLELLADTLAVCRLAADAPVPAWAVAPGRFVTISRTAEELSLAEAGLSIFATSTFDTDYVLVKARDLEAAVTALERAGHRVSR